MNRPSAGQATGLAGIFVGAAAIAGVIAQIELGGQPHPHVWSNAWLLTSLVLVGIALVVVLCYFVASIFVHEETKRVDAAAVTDEAHESQSEDMPQEVHTDVGMTTDEQFEASETEEISPDSYLAAVGTWIGELDFGQTVQAPRHETNTPHTREPAFTGRWRHTADGFEASPLMNMTSLAMPGFMTVHGQSPVLRIGVALACEPSPANASSSLYGAKLLDLLRRDPVASLIKSAIKTDDGLAWTRLGRQRSAQP